MASTARVALVIEALEASRSQRTPTGQLTAVMPVRPRLTVRQVIRGVPTYGAWMTEKVLGTGPLVAPSPLTPRAHGGPIVTGPARILM